MTEQKYDLEKLRVEALDAATEAFDGDSQLAELWLREQITALGGERPIDQLRDVEGIEILRQIINKIEHGFP